MHLCIPKSLTMHKWFLGTDKSVSYRVRLLVKEKSVSFRGNSPSIFLFCVLHSLGFADHIDLDLTIPPCGARVLE